MTDPSSGAPAPPLGPGDIYVYAHANGAIYVGYGDGRSLLAPLDEAVAIARGCVDAGARVVVAADDAPIAAQAIERIGAGIAVVPFPEGTAPHRWDEGTNALIEAASLGTDHLLDDLIARGVDVDHRDDSGSTALHHAAAAGNLHAIDSLVAAGAAVDVRNERGSTPRDLAAVCGRQDAVDRLLAHGTTGPPPRGSTSGVVHFSSLHAGTAYIWLLPVVGAAIAIVATWPVPPIGWAGAVAFVVAYGLAVPPLAFWRGGIPRELDGTSLSVRAPFGRRRTVDLAEVSVAAAGGSAGGSAFVGGRWLLLGHPSGARVSRRTLRRLLVPKADIDDLLGRQTPFVVVPLDGAKRDEVILAVGDQLAARGVHLSPTLRAQLQRARQASAGTGTVGP